MVKRLTTYSGSPVALLGQGSWHLGQQFKPAKEEVAALQAGFDTGMNLIDTAEMYGDGLAEKLIAQALVGYGRESLYLVSKVLPSHATSAGIVHACEQSLKRLGVDYLDLYLLHWRSVASLPEVVKAFEKLFQSQKIRHWGVSNFGLDDMQELFKLQDGENCLVNQVMYNVATRGIEFDLQPWCDAHEVSIMGYAPLGSGSGLLNHPALGQIARLHGCSAAAVALAWVIRSQALYAIAEMGSSIHVLENAKALALTLTSQDMAILEQAFPSPKRQIPLAVL